MSDCDHMCTKCDEKSCIEFKPKMAVPRELQTDYEMMITANLLMAASIESSKCKNDQLQAENDKLRELVQGLWFAAQYLGINPDGATGSGFARQMRELGIEVPE